VLFSTDGRVSSLIPLQSSKAHSSETSNNNGSGQTTNPRKFNNRSSSGPRASVGNSAGVLKLQNPMKLNRVVDQTPGTEEELFGDGDDKGNGRQRSRGDGSGAGGRGRRVAASASLGTCRRAIPFEFSFRLCIFSLTHFVFELLCVVA
jgi:hypothetical protein